MTQKQIEMLIKDSIPESKIIIEDLRGDGDHYSATVISKTSQILFPLNFISKVSLLYLFPLQTSQLTYISGKKCISTFITPSPRHDSHLPPFTLKLNLPGL